MQPKTKKFIGIGVTLTITAIAIYFGYKFIDKKITEASLRKAKIKDEKENPIINTETPTIEPNKIPAMIGKTAYPKSTGIDKYVNVRSENYVNNGWINNFIGKVLSPNPVGKVLEVTINGEGTTWYKVAPVIANLKDDKTLGKADKKATTGYVREDNVILK